MTNLIVTVIAIGLVSAMALSTMWYGGSAYMGSTARAQAIAAMEQAKQIAIAWRAWSVNNKGQTSLIDINWSASGGDTSDDLVPGYILQLPRSGISTTAFWFPDNWAIPAFNGTSSTATTLNAVRIIYSYSEQVLSVCKAYNIATQNNSTVYNGVQASLLPSYCYYTDVNASSTPDAGDTFSLIYKVF